MEEELLPVLPAGMQSKLLIETMANALISGFFYLFDQYQGQRRGTAQNDDGLYDDYAVSYSGARRGRNTVERI